MAMSIMINANGQKEKSQVNEKAVGKKPQCHNGSSGKKVAEQRFDSHFGA